MNHHQLHRKLDTPHGRHFFTVLARRPSWRISRLVRDSARPVAQVARDLGIADHLLYRWRAEQYQAEHQGHTRQSMRAEQEELARLRRENTILKQERDFLKRAAAFLAKESR